MLANALLLCYKLRCFSVQTIFMPRSYPLIIALTGGIGSGKSTAASFFSDLGVPIIDADQLSRELVMPGSEILKEIITYFGQDYLDTTGNLNRHKLRQRIFEFPEDRQWLERILHPKIYALMKAKIKALFLLPDQKNIPYIICVIPLLFETGKPDFIDCVLVIDTEESAQITRAVQRDNLTESQVQNSLKSQCNREIRLKGADDIIDNNGDAAQLKSQVLKLDQKYRFDSD
jgi:dephospho-CoA kinase